MSDGMVKLDSEIGKAIGFTSDKFGGYLWVNGKNLIISFIESRSKGQGSFSKLVADAEAAGYTVQVPTPLAQMEGILNRWGWTPKIVADERFGEVELWSR